MTKRSEDKILETKKREWDDSLRGFDKFMRKAKKEIKYNVTNWLDTYFGDGGKSTSDKFFHRFGVLIVDFILLRLLRLI